MPLAPFSATRLGSTGLEAVLLVCLAALPWTATADQAGPAQPPAAAAGLAATSLPERPTAFALAGGLTAFGPRPAGSPAKARAAVWLLEQMRRQGLEGVRSSEVAGVPGARNLEGVLPGIPGGGAIVLSAHYDTVAGTPGAGDDASGCGVVLATAAELLRTPLQHTVRVVLFDAEEVGLRGSRTFLEHLGPEGRDRVLAGINLEMLGWPDSPGATILAWGVPRDGRLAQPPAWLVHALLRAGEAAEWPLALTDPTLTVPAQLLVRSTLPAFGTDADPFLRAGVPAVTLSDSPLLAIDPAYHRPEDTADRLDPARLAHWTRTAAAAVRRLDALAGRPVPEDRYLAACGRVWLHRDLLWVGFVLWGMLVAQGFLRRRRRGAPAGDGAAVQRRGFTAFPFRLLLLLSVVTTPVFAILLWPAAALTLAVPARRGLRLLSAALGLLPALVYTGALLWAWRLGFVGPWAPPLPGAPLIAAALLAFGYLVWRGPESRSDASVSIVRSHSSSVE